MTRPPRKSNADTLIVALKLSANLHLAKDHPTRKNWCAVAKANQALLEHLLGDKLPFDMVQQANAAIDAQMARRGKA